MGGNALFGGPVNVCVCRTHTAINTWPLLPFAAC